LKFSGGPTGRWTEKAEATATARPIFFESGMEIIFDSSDFEDGWHG
jgi:hypothetical protein